MEIAEKLRILRTNCELKQSDIARVLNISESAYQKIEVAKNMLTIENAIALAKYYDFTVDDLLDKSSEIFEYALLYRDYPNAIDFKYDTNPSVYDAGLKGCAKLYRCINKGGCKYSAIIYKGREVYSCPREREYAMIKYWNEVSCKNGIC